MPANVSINLLNDSKTGNSPVGRIVNWAVSYGRYIMIGTEIVVLLAFISRFSLDRRLTDLKEEVSQKEDIIQANAPFEQEVRTLQNRIANIKTLLSQPTGILDLFSVFQSLIPRGTYLTSISVVKHKLTAQAISGSSGSFAQFIANLQNAKTIHSIEINDITRDQLSGIRYSFTANIARTITK